MKKTQHMDDTTDEKQYVVIAIGEYQALISESDQGWEDVPYTVGEDDDVTIPNDVVGIMANQDVSLLAAWRIHTGLSQYDVAEKLGTTQSAVSQWEAVGSKPHKKNRERLAAIYGCKPEQMIP